MAEDNQETKKEKPMTFARKLKLSQSAHMTAFFLSKFWDTQFGCLILQVDFDLGKLEWETVGSFGQW